MMRRATSSSPTFTKPAARKASDFSYLKVSNLVEGESCAEVLRILAEAGMAETDLREFENQVVKFNATIPTGSLLKVGFQPLKESSDEGKAAIATAAEAHNKNLINCRITAFTAGRSLLGVGNSEGADGSELFTDLETIKSDTQTFTVADRDAFTGIFGRIPTTAEKDSETHVANIMEYQKNMRSLTILGKRA